MAQGKTQGLLEEHTMKQHITIEQLAELTPDQHKKWRTYLESNHSYGQTHCMSDIGQMIAFLDEHEEVGVTIWRRERVNGEIVWAIANRIDKLITKPNRELCDALWECVKQILEQEKA